MFFNVVLKIDIDFIDAFMYLLYRALLSHVAYLISLHTYTLSFRNECKYPSGFLGSIFKCTTREISGQKMDFP